MSSAVATLPDLERVAGHVHAAQRAALFAQYLATPGAQAEPEEAAPDTRDARARRTWRPSRGPRPAPSAQAADRAGEAAKEAGHALALLQGLGARAAPVPAPSEPIPLHLLDTADTRELLALVRQAVALAERVDRARGRALGQNFPLQPGETYGTDLAESLSEIALRLKIEVEGPTDRRQRSQ